MILIDMLPQSFTSYDNEAPPPEENSCRYPDTLCLHGVLWDSDNTLAQPAVFCTDMAYIPPVFNAKGLNLHKRISGMVTNHGKQDYCLLSPLAYWDYLNAITHFTLDL